MEKPIELAGILELLTVMLIGLFHPTPTVWVVAEGVSPRAEFVTVTAIVVVLVTDPSAPVTTTG
jgi:hypothetical protein